MIYLVRHGQTDWNIEKKTQGQTDIPLNNNGRKQAEILANHISNLKVDKIISSDLLRAKETAEIINKKFGKKIILDQRLREANYGNIEGVPRDEITQEMWNLLNETPEKIDAETKLSIYNRIKSFCDELFKELEFTNQNVIVVTHGGALRMIMYYANNKNEFDNERYMKDYRYIKIFNTEIYEWDKSIKLYQF